MFNKKGVIITTKNVKVTHQIENQSWKIDVDQKGNDIDIYIRRNGGYGSGIFVHQDQQESFFKIIEYLKDFLKGGE